MVSRMDSPEVRVDPGPAAGPYTGGIQLFMSGGASCSPLTESVSRDRRLAGGGWDAAVFSTAEFGKSEGQVFLSAAAVEVRNIRSLCGVSQNQQQ